MRYTNQGSPILSEDRVEEPGTISMFDQGRNESGMIEEAESSQAIAHRISWGTIP